MRWPKPPAPTRVYRQVAPEEEAEEARPSSAVRVAAVLLRQAVVARAAVVQPQLSEAPAVVGLGALPRQAEAALDRRLIRLPEPFASVRGRRRYFWPDRHRQ